MQIIFYHKVKRETYLEFELHLTWQLTDNQAFDRSVLIKQQSDGTPTRYGSHNTTCILGIFRFR